MSEELNDRFHRRRQLGTYAVLQEAAEELVDGVACYADNPQRLVYVMLDVAERLNGHANVGRALQERTAEVGQARERTTPLTVDDPQASAITFDHVPPGATFRRLDEPLPRLYIKAGTRLAAPLDGGITLRLVAQTPVNIVVATFADVPPMSVFAAHLDDRELYVKVSGEGCVRLREVGTQSATQYALSGEAKVIPVMPKRTHADLAAAAAVVVSVPFRDAEVLDDTPIPDLPSVQLRWRESQYTQLYWTSAAWGMRSVPDWVIGGALAAHDYDCSLQQLEAMDARIAYFLVYPTVCRACRGLGGGYDSVVAARGHGPDWVPCPGCLERKRCSRCGHRTLMGQETQQGHHKLWCQTCGWTEGREVDAMPAEPQCLCTLRDGDTDDGNAATATE